MSYSLKIRFTDLSPDKFWISMEKEYPIIHRKAINILLQFSTSYMYEQAFSYLNFASIANTEIR